MQTLPNGVQVFTNGDGYNLAEDIASAFKTAEVIISVTTEAQRNALPALLPGRMITVRRLDLNGYMQWWDGSTWRAVMPTFAEYASSSFLNSTVPAGGQVGPFYQTFPAGRFTVAPIITFAGSNARHGFSAADVTAAGFNLYIRNDTSVATITGATIYFVAKQMTPTTAAG